MLFAELDAAAVCEALASSVISLASAATPRDLVYAAVTLLWLVLYVRRRNRPAPAADTGFSPEYDLKTQLLAQLDRPVLIRESGGDKLATPGCLRFHFFSDGRLYHIYQRVPVPGSRIEDKRQHDVRVDDQLNARELAEVGKKARTVLRSMQEADRGQRRRQLAYSLNAPKGILVPLKADDVREARGFSHPADNPSDRVVG